ncbi:MAG: carboxymuconolactone decarboxylase family protein [Rariglobus sp.]
MDHWAVAPALMQSMLDLSQLGSSAGIDPGLHFLINLRVSQINNCAYCMNMHSCEARAHGESEQRLNLLSAWHETNLFTPRECAALHWAEVLTRLSSGPVTDADFALVRAEFSEFEVAALTLLVATINAWNRFGVGFRPSIETVAP